MDEDSILNSIKKLLGIAPDYDVFDTDILIHINSAFSILHNVGAAPVDGFFITGPEEKWSAFIEDRQNILMVKTYIYLKVRLVFDPPATSFAIAAVQEQIRELEFRLNTLELVFNHLAYGEDPTKLYVIDESEGFPPEAALGDVGFNPVTGDVYRQVR